MKPKASVDELIERLTKSADNVRNATNPRQRDAHMTFMTRRAAEIEDARDLLVRKLDNGWDVLNLWKEDGKPEDYERHHARYMGLLADYERVCDALHEASRRWTQPADVKIGAVA